MVRSGFPSSRFAERGACIIDGACLQSSRTSLHRRFAGRFGVLIMVGPRGPLSCWLGAFGDLARNILFRPRCFSLTEQNEWLSARFHRHESCYDECSASPEFAAIRREVLGSQVIREGPFTRAFFLLAAALAVALGTSWRS